MRESSPTVLYCRCAAFNFSLTGVVKITMPIFKTLSQIYVPALFFQRDLKNLPDTHHPAARLGAAWSQNCNPDAAFVRV
ncbi:hypothetical protein [Ralstonia mannitolilytica]|uniref:hypothetical protein n=1 Tax=Ralstonia mannitolilytica TaxID=105219 RepID=UPI00292F8B2F|nr:hypothetical protein [Ralstonia mannitolilytica]